MQGDGNATQTGINRSRKSFVPRKSRRRREELLIGQLHMLVHRDQVRVATEVLRVSRDQLRCDHARILRVKEESRVFGRILDELVNLLKDGMSFRFPGAIMDADKGRGQQQLAKCEARIHNTYFGSTLAILRSKRQRKSIE